MEQVVEEDLLLHVIPNDHNSSSFNVTTTTNNNNNTLPDNNDTTSQDSPNGTRRSLNLQPKPLRSSLLHETTPPGSSRRRRFFLRQQQQPRHLSLLNDKCFEASQQLYHDHPSLQTLLDDMKQQVVLNESTCHWKPSSQPQPPHHQHPPQPSSYHCRVDGTDLTAAPAFAQTCQALGGDLLHADFTVTCLFYDVWTEEKDDTLIPTTVGQFDIYHLLDCFEAAACNLWQDLPLLERETAHHLQRELEQHLVQDVPGQHVSCTAHVHIQQTNDAAAPSLLGPTTFWWPWALMNGLVVLEAVLLF